MVRRTLRRLPQGQRDTLRASIGEYLAFRQKVDRFFERHFAGFCGPKCFQSRLSACCSKEGIVTFFADVAVNALVSAPEEIERLAVVLEAPHTGRNCVYLGPNGCCWRVSPIVCAMFLCDTAKTHAFLADPDCEAQWQSIRRQRNAFTWPDRPVLFDYLEQVFIDAGCRSELMYLHRSPGMLRIKRQCLQDQR